jgi:hypothetical protein
MLFLLSTAKLNRAERFVRIERFYSEILIDRVGHAGSWTDRERLKPRLDRPFDVEELTAGLSNETYLAAHP